MLCVFCYQELSPAITVLFSAWIASGVGPYDDYIDRRRIRAAKCHPLLGGRLVGSGKCHPSDERATDNATVGAGSVVNDVQFAYNSFSQPTADYQSHSGAVNVSTTPKVQYAYADGSANRIRPTAMKYPNGRVLNYDYGTANRRLG